MNMRNWISGVFLASCLSFNLLATQASAFSLAPFSVQQMAQQADKIFVGTCISVEEHMNAYGLSVLTITFAVHEALKGNVGETVTFQQLNPVQPPSANPRVGGLRTDISTFSLPRYESGEEAVLFLAKKGRIGLTSPLGLSQGKIPVSVSQTGQKMIKNTALREEGRYQSGIPARGQAGEYRQFVTAVRALVQNGQ